MFKRLPLAVLLVGATSAWGQQVISAHSGVIHFVEGTVTLDGQPVHPKFAEFPDVKNGQTLAAEDGRAEVLLTPGVILRIAEDSSFQMVSNSRSDTRFSVLSGSAIVEVGELLSSNAITVIYNDAHIELVKKGLYRIDSDPGKLRVYEGEARVTAANQTLVARKGREVLLGAVLDMSGFDVKDTDAFLRWASRRSEELAQANVSSARSASGLGYSGSSYGNGYGSGYGYGSGMMGMGAWAYNPWYGMFTYMPYGDSLYYSPFGYPFYSPMNVGYLVPNSFSGSAFPISSSATSPHFGATTGSVTMAPRGSYGTSNGGTFGSGATGAARSGGVFSGGNSGSSGAGSASGGGMSSGAAGHAGGGAGSRGK
jgi:hypothetical protein